MFIDVGLAPKCWVSARQLGGGRGCRKQRATTGLIPGLAPGLLSYRRCLQVRPAVT